MFLNVSDYYGKALMRNSATYFYMYPIKMTLYHLYQQKRASKLKDQIILPYARFQ